MDITTIKKYFNFGDDVEISTPQSISIGRIVDLSDYVLVIEDALGNPIMISVDTIISCRKVADITSNDTNQENGNSPEVDNITRIISDIVASLDEIYVQCSINNEEIIPTNATVTEISPQRVEVLRDDGEKISCVKSSFVGYTRENAAIGKRVFCSPGKNNISYASLTEMSYGEMYERVLRAINTKPKPRTSILGSVLFLLTNVFGNSIIIQKKAIKQLTKQLMNASGFPVKSTLDGFSSEQKKKIYDLLENYISDILDLDTNEQIRFVDKTIREKLGFNIKRKGIKTIITDLMQDKSNSQNNNILESTNTSSYIPATCEISRYYVQYHNGVASDSKNDEIRFKDEVIIGESLANELKNFQWWVKSNQPIPVVCEYKKIGKWQTALFITRPGSLDDFRQRISDLKIAGKKELAEILQKYLEGLGYVDNFSIQFSDSTPSSELLATTRRKRLIKNFEEAEKGFLEVIRRKYELDVTVRDLAMMYQEWGKTTDAINLLESYLPQLNDKMKVYNMLHIFYHSAGFDEKAIGILEKALELHDGNTKQSRTQREKILKKINRLKGKKQKSKGNRITTFSIDNIPSPLLRYEANNTNSEVLSYITTESFEKKWQFVNKRIDELKNTPDVPAYYLAKIQLLEERGESGTSAPVRMALADYCKARARNFFYDGNETSGRIYLLQGMSVYEREDFYYLLLISLSASCKDVLSKYNVPVASYEDISNQFSLRKEDEVLGFLLQMINKDTIMSRKLIRHLYESEASSWLSDELNIDNSSPQVFIDSLNELSQSLNGKLSSFDESSEKILLESSPAAFGKKILEIPFFSSKEVSDQDARNLSKIREVANFLIDIEEKDLEYEDCEDICRNAFAKIDASVLDIEKNPSPISTMNLLPLFLKTRDLMEHILDKRYTETIPHIVIEAIDDARPIEDEIEIQISISNEPGFSRANNGIFRINSINDKDVSSLSLVTVLDNPIAGGNKTNIVFLLKSTYINSANVEIDYTFDYQDVRKIARTKHEKLNLAINKGDDYEDFGNPYIEHVKSNAVKDKSMFKGRNELIDNICKYVLDDYKGFVLYGQKRSGKSSVLYHITQRLREEHKAFAVEFTMGSSIVKDSESENDSLANLFYSITSEIGRAIKEVDRTVYKESNCHIIRRKEFVEFPEETFRENLDFYRDIIVDKLHYEQNKIVLIVDEFTYLYKHILDGKISPGIMEFWKDLVDSREFSFVFAGQDAMPRFMDAFPNVFTSMHPQELTYIDEKSARELIEEPIWNKKKDCSRFHPDAVDEIIKLTACSPFYIMIICSELVKYARQRKRLPIQANDVNALVQRMICNESSISRRDFDNLISCGDSSLDVIDKDDALKVLKDIAVKARNIDYYDVNAINI